MLGILDEPHWVVLVGVDVLVVAVAFVVALPLAYLSFSCFVWALQVPPEQTYSILWEYSMELFALD